MTGGQVTLLLAIKYAPGIGVRGLATQGRMSPAAISKAVAKLEQQGLVERRALEETGAASNCTSRRRAIKVLRSVRSRRTI